MDLLRKAIEKGFILKHPDYILVDCQRWLREEKKIYLNISLDYCSGVDKPLGIWYSLEVLQEKAEEGPGLWFIYQAPFFATYEEALEAGLVEALNCLPD